MKQKSHEKPFLLFPPLRQNLWALVMPHPIFSKVRHFYAQSKSKYSIIRFWWHTYNCNAGGYE